MKRLVTGIGIFAAGVLIVWLLYELMQGEVPDGVSYVIPALVYVVGGMLIGRLVTGWRVRLDINQQSRN